MTKASSDALLRTDTRWLNTTYIVAGLIGRIGADKTAYAAVLFPVIALGISTMFEDYQWTLRALFGFALVLLGTHRAESCPYPGVTACEAD